MSDMNQAAIDALHQAVELAPGNVPLAQQLSSLLNRLMKYDDAEQVIRGSLKHNPGSVDLQLTLAELYYRRGSDSHALAIAETLTGKSDADPRAMVLHARLKHRGGDVYGAVAMYRDAVDADSEIADLEFESLLGIGDFRDQSSDTDPQPAAWQADADDDDLDIAAERPQDGFESVGGMEGVKEEIRVKIIYPMNHADMYAAYGKKIGGGILLYGPPGCGKTHLARATAGEVQASFMSVGINDVLDMWIGNSEKNLHGLFEQARRAKPCVLFFDEVDALGASRSDMKKSGGRQLINQFLSELDGVESDNEGVLCLAATNTPWHLDSAFRRPGRFDRVIFVPPPDEPARAQILEIQLAGKPTESIDYKKLAAKSRDFSGADLGAVVDRAIEAKLHEAVKTGMPKPITTKDLLAAMKNVRPSTGEWFSTARNHALYANEGGLYDEILDYLKVKR